ncbi:hypothetical protein C3R19_29325, partial [Blautia producta]
IYFKITASFSVCGCRSIDISSPRLHCGRAANYGSIIIPGRIIALYGCRPYISAHGFARHTNG